MPRDEIMEQTRALIGFDISRFPAFAGERGGGILHMPAGVRVGIFGAFGPRLHLGEGFHSAALMQLYGNRAVAVDMQP